MSNLLTQIEQILNIYHVLELGIPLIEKRSLIGTLKELASNWQTSIYEWDLANGFSANLLFNSCQETREPEDQKTRGPDETTVIAFSHPSLMPSQQVVLALKHCLEYQGDGIFVLENIQSFLSTCGAFGEAQLVKSWLLNTIERCKLVGNKYLILLDTEEALLPTNLAAVIPSLVYPLPSVMEIEAAVIEALSEEVREYDNEVITELAIASTGLTKEEIKLGVKLAIRSQDRRIKSFVLISKEHSCPKPLDINKLVRSLVSYKINRLRAEGLEFMPPPDVSDFGGLDRLKAAIERVRADFSPEARKHNLPIPKGWLLVGPPGTGKSLGAKIVAQKLSFPLISIGVDRVKAGGAIYLKKLLQRIDAVGGAAAYFDEFDKFFADQHDARTKEVLGVLLTWLQEKTSKTFTIATLNRFDSLPVELTRAGRFDRIYYVDFPTAIERFHIFLLHLSRFDSRYQILLSDIRDKFLEASPLKLSSSLSSQPFFEKMRGVFSQNIGKSSPLTELEWRTLLQSTFNFTGAEICSLVEDAAKNCFYAGSQQIDLEDLMAAREQMTSLFARDPEPILAMQNRAKKCSEPASSPDESIFAPPDTNLWGQKKDSLRTRPSFNSCQQNINGRMLD